MIDAKLSDLGAEVAHQAERGGCLRQDGGGKEGCHGRSGRMIQPRRLDAGREAWDEIDPLDAELQDALGKLGDVLGDVFGAKLNVTGPQYSAADLRRRSPRWLNCWCAKGFKNFAQATAKAAQVMRANAATRPRGRHQRPPVEGGVQRDCRRPRRHRHRRRARGLTADDVKAMVTGKPEAKASEVKPMRRPPTGPKLALTHPKKPTKDDTQAQEAPDDSTLQSDAAALDQPLDAGQQPAGPAVSRGACQPRRKPRRANDRGVPRHARTL